MNEKLIKNITFGKNINGYTIAIIDCHARQLSICGVGVGNSEVTFMVTTAKTGYLTECVCVPFEPEPNTDYTIVECIDKDQITIIVVPLEFIGIKGVDYE